MTGALVLLGAVVVTALIALVWSIRNGRFAAVPTAADPLGPEATGDQPSEPSGSQVTADEIGAVLGSRLTLVQFSSAFCSPCRATRALLADVTKDRSDVVHVEIDAESHLGLVRRLDIRRTPTVLVLDASGTVIGRASGLPSRDQVERVIGPSS